MSASRGRSLRKLLILVVVSAIALQLYFLLRIVCMAVVDPDSTTFQRSEAWRLLREPRPLRWRQQQIEGSIRIGGHRIDLWQRGRVVVNCYCRQEATFGADLVHDWPGCADFCFAGMGRIFGVQIQVIESGLRAAQHPEPHPPGRHRDDRVDAAID